MSSHSEPSSSVIGMHPAATSPSASLRQRLLFSIVPVALLPLIIASGIGYFETQRRNRNQAVTTLAAEANTASNVTAEFVENALLKGRTALISPLVLSSIQDAAEFAESEGLDRQDIDSLEAQFGNDKLLQPNAELNQFLSNVAEVDGFAEIFFTERNGLNVAFSNPTSDFVQNDETWWQESQANGVFIEEPEFDESANAVVVAISQAIRDPESGEFLGVAKAGVPATNLENAINDFLGNNLIGTETVQIVDINGILLTGVSSAGIMSSSDTSLIGGDTLLEAVSSLRTGLGESAVQDLGPAARDSLTQQLSQLSGIGQVSIGKAITFELNERLFSLSFIPETDWVSIASVETAQVAASSRQLLTIFMGMAVLLGVAAATAIALVARSLSAPLAKLTNAAQQVSAGNLDLKAPVEGTSETRTLAENFNRLVAQVKESLAKQEAATQEQLKMREALEQDIFTLMDDMEGAVDGDLTVRAQLASEDMSTVADLFNAIIESLRDIASKVKESTIQVSSSLDGNEIAMRELVEQAQVEAKDIRQTLESVESMSSSVQNVSSDASQAAQMATETVATVQASSDAMTQTVDSILNLRSTVGETSKKMKRLGESSQKISQVVSLIEEIALKTNLLAINASVEASRAGEQGQGFTVVAEQVGALAEQSATATKEIAQIVAGIQAETQEVSEAMDVGTTQVVDTTRLVENTKANLDQVLQRSQTINQLMQSISSSTDSQSSASLEVRDLMQQISESAQQRSVSAEEIASATQISAFVAKTLSLAVEQFKVDEQEGQNPQPSMSAEAQLKVAELEQQQQHTVNSASST